ncbi:MAG TPA: carboxypeptidase regulatory-like domain-containing protein [Planctomycetota bacterium]
MRIQTAISSLALAALAANAAAASTDPVPANGTLAGKVVFHGEATAIPKLAKLDMASKPEHAAHCLAASDTSERGMLVDKASLGIANVFVEIRKVNKDEWDPKGVVLQHADQDHCRFEPHVLVVPVGADVKFANSDPFMHNVHFYAKKNPAANFGIPEKGEKIVAFKADEKVRVKCDVHPWMDSWVVVTSNPFHALTGPDGSYSIPNVPPGTYEVRYWHETLGSLKVKDVVIGEGPTNLDVQHDNGDWKA